MAMLAGDYTRRTRSTQGNSAVSAGLLVLPFHIPNSTQGDFQVANESSVCTGFSINIAPSSGSVNVFFQDSAGTKQDIAMGLTTARDYRIPFYCPWPLFISTPGQGEDLTFYIAAGGKGITGPV